MSYANLPKATQKGKSGGYKPSVWFAPVASIDTWARPIAVPVVPGDKVKVVTAHTFADGEGAYKWDAKPNSVKITGSSVGDEGAQQVQWVAETIILGDNPAVQEIIQDAMNDDGVVFLKDSDCLDNDTYIQMGDDCTPVTVSCDFDSFTTAEGQKAYTVRFTSKKKFHYMAALTEAE